MGELLTDVFGAAKPAAPTHSGMKPTRANGWKREEGCAKKVVAKAYFVEVMEAKRQAHHEDGESTIVPPSVAGRSCKEGKKIKINKCCSQ